MANLAKKIRDQSFLFHNPCNPMGESHGGINTGRFEYEMAKETNRRNPYLTFKGHLQKVLEWKKDFDKFIGELLEKENEEYLYPIIEEKLARSSTQ